MVSQRLYTLEQVAEIYQVSPATVRGWRYRKVLNVVKLPGGSVRVNQAEVDRLVSGNAAPDAGAVVERAKASKRTARPNGLNDGTLEV